LEKTIRENLHTSRNTPAKEVHRKEKKEYNLQIDGTPCFYPKF
jgi:hypothetical protein